MRNLFLSLFLIAATFVSAQKHSNYGSVKVLSAYTQSTFGYNAGYYVEFKNNGTKSVDGMKWRARFYNNFGELVGSRDGQWQSGNFTKPIPVGGTTEDLEGVLVEGATKVFITMKMVHYSDGTSVKRK